MVNRQLSNTICFAENGNERGKAEKKVREITRESGNTQSVENI